MLGNLCFLAVWALSAFCENLSQVCRTDASLTRDVMKYHDVVLPFSHWFKSSRIAIILFTIQYCEQICYLYFSEVFKLMNLTLLSLCQTKTCYKNIHAVDEMDLHFKINAHHRWIQKIVFFVVSHNKSTTH